jgi:transcriptional regulator with XRE-family HTH domain
MTSLRQLLASNMKSQRRALGLSQEKLAARVNAAPTYIAMIEIQRKFPSVEMLERIATALNIDAPELFSTQTTAAVSLSKLHEMLLMDIGKTANKKMQELEADIEKLVGDRIDTLKQDV